ncbi:MAG: CoA-binding protein [Dehalococcoidia bacterium]|nr:CoA-binding protein [Dehalococcoidia bacterium]
MNNDIAQRNKDLNKLFYPESIAVIGASGTEGKLGYNVFRNLIEQGYSGRLYPVNPNAKYIQGMKSYVDILDIEDEIDVAVVIVPARAAPEMVEKCCAGGVKFIVNEAAGFAEMGSEGRAIELAMKQSLVNSATRMVGPNCSGIINTNINMVQSIGLVGHLKRGRVGLIGQAGVYAAGILWGLRRVMDFGIVATVGNKVDIDGSDMLAFLGYDDDIEVICIYMEDARDGRKFIDVAREVTRRKPVIALKGGRTDKGKRAAASHTASMAGKIEVYDAAFKQSGVIRAKDNQDMFNIARAFAKQPLPKGTGVMLISYAGSMGVTGTDACYENGLELAKLSSGSIGKLRAIMPAVVEARNPADFTFDQTGEQVAETIRICAHDDSVSAFVAVVQAEIADTYIEPLKNTDFNGKPLLVCIPGMEFAMDSVIRLENEGLPVYATPEVAVRILSEMYQYHRMNL